MTKVKAPKTEKKTKKVAPRKDYHLEVRVNDIVFKTKAKDLNEALTQFINSPEFPFAPKTKTFITFGKGKNASQRLFHVPEARRIFSMISHKPSALEVLATKLTRSIA